MIRQLRTATAGGDMISDQQADRFGPDFDFTDPDFMAENSPAVESFSGSWTAGRACDKHHRTSQRTAAGPAFTRIAQSYL
jgi:hypothetical protein